MTIWEMTKRYGFHFVSLIAVVVFMVIGYSPMLSVFYSTVLAFGDERARARDRAGPQQLFIALLLSVPARECCSRLSRSRHRAFSGELSRRISHADFDFDWSARLSGLTQPVNRDPVIQETDRRHGRRLNRCAQRGDHLRGGRHHRPCRHADRSGPEILLIVIDFAGGSLLMTAIYTFAGGLDHRARGAGGRVLHHLRGDRSAGVDQARCARLRRAYVHLLLCGVVGSLSADRVVAICRGRDHRRRSLQDHDAGMEIYVASIPGAVRVCARSTWCRLADENSEGWIGLRHYLDHRGRPSAGLGALSVAAQNWGLRRNTVVERGIVPVHRAFCWCFRACSKPPGRERITGLRTSPIRRHLVLALGDGPTAVAVAKPSPRLLRRRHKAEKIYSSGKRRAQLKGNTPNYQGGRR